MEELRKLNGFFPQKVFVGGSYATYKTLGIDKKTRDIDVFILTNRKEHWALIMLLNSIFPGATLDFSMEDPSNYYKIPKQWKRIVVKTKDTNYDLIFCDLNSIQDIIAVTSNTLSKFYYSFKYRGTASLTLAVENYPHIKDDIYGLVVDKVNNVYTKYCTEPHLQKILTRTKELGLTARIVTM